MRTLRAPSWRGPYRWLGDEDEVVYAGASRARLSSYVEGYLFSVPEKDRDFPRARYVWDPQKAQKAEKARDARKYARNLVAKQAAKARA